MQEIFEVYRSLRRKLEENEVTSEAIVVQLDTECRDLMFYLPIIFAVLSTDNAFHFIHTKDEINEVKCDLILGV